MAGCRQKFNLSELIQLTPAGHSGKADFQKKTITSPNKSSIMKQLLFVLAAIITANGVSAQKNFEGKIVYLLEADKDEKKPELTVLFSPGKVKLTFKENEEPDEKYVLVIIDSGKVYSINTNTKQYKQKKLQEIEIAGTYTPVKRTIAGHATTSAKQVQSGPAGILGGIISFKNMVFDVADSLVFNVPSKFLNNPELMMISGNHIVLGAQMSMGSPFAEAMDGESGNENEQEKMVKKITVNATSVTPMSFTADEFAIPAGYELEVRKPYEMPSADTAAAMFDTTMMAVDTAAVYVPAKKPARKPVKKATKKAPIKSAARKQ
jgi:hypothetical protein